MTPVSRKDAREAGAAHYFTGMPCKNGHLALRWVSNSTCLACHREINARNRAADPDRDRRYYSANKAACAARNAKWKAQNRERAAELTRKSNLRCKEARRANSDDWKRRNPERVALRRAEHQRANRSKLNAQESLRRATRLAATPAWADKAAIAAFFVRAKELAISIGTRVEVDHIVPLRHPLVCGLHCEANLQLLAESENRRKSNKVWPDMPGVRSG